MPSSMPTDYISMFIGALERLLGDSKRLEVFSGDKVVQNLCNFSLACDESAQMACNDDDIHT